LPLRYVVQQARLPYQGTSSFFDDLSGMCFVSEDDTLSTWPSITFVGPMVSGARLCLSDALEPDLSRTCACR
jgi:hypothetical protein